MMLQPVYPDQMLRVVIVGGGISGLSTAWALQQRAKADGITLQVTILERGARWGGKVLTEQVDGFIVEAGPDSFLTQKPWALQLARELGLEAHLLGTNDTVRDLYVLQNGKPKKLPDGVLLVVPTKFMPFALSSLISPLGKLRMGLDLVIPARKDDADETLAAFIRRRLGSEALDKIAEPLMSGIYNADAESQSLLATFPRFRQIERDYGSLIRGMLAARRKTNTPAAPQGKPSALFMSLTGGTQQLIEALVTRLHADLCLGVAVEAIRANPDGSYTIRTTDGLSLDADDVVLTAPTYDAAALLRGIAPIAAEKLAAIRYVSTGTISLGFRKQDLKQPLQGFGVVVPGSEKRPINAITISSNKFDHRAPDDQVLLRVFFGGSRSPASMALDDEHLLAVVRAELRSILGIEAAPLFHRIYRWHCANPQYDLGHMAHVDALEAALPAGVYVTGSAYRGVGLPDCIYHARQTADKIIGQFQSRQVENSRVTSASHA